MSFLEEIQEVFNSIELKTGKPLEILLDRSLQVLAKVKMARSNALVHLLLYNLNARGVNYVIAYQLDFVLQLFENPPDKRYDFAANDLGRRSAQYTIKVDHNW